MNPARPFLRVVVETDLITSDQERDHRVDLLPKRPDSCWRQRPDHGHGATLGELRLRLGVEGGDAAAEEGYWSALARLAGGSELAETVLLRLRPRSAGELLAIAPGHQAVLREELIQRALCLATLPPSATDVGLQTVARGAMDHHQEGVARALYALEHDRLVTSGDTKAGVATAALRWEIALSYERQVAHPGAPVPEIAHDLMRGALEILESSAGRLAPLPEALRGTGELLQCRLYYWLGAQALG